jgi:hypothetical protein
VLTERGAAAALLTCVLLLAGCGGGEADGEQLPPPPTPGTSPEAAPDASGDDATADEPGADSTEEGSLEAEVERAVRDYYDAINAAQYEGKIDELEAKSDPSCNCRELVGVIEQERQLGVIRGGEWSVTDVAVQNVLPESASVQATVRAQDGEVVAPDGSVAATINNRAGSPSRLLMALIQEEGKWLVAQIREA